MSKEMYISSSPHETKVAILEDDQLVEVYFERDTDVGLVGGIYKGRVSRVLPGMQSAFVDIGLERDAFLYVSDFYEDQEEYDKVFEEAEARATKFTTQQQQAAAPEPTVTAAATPTEPQASSEAPAPSLAEPLAASTSAEAPVAEAPSPTPVFTPHQPKDSHERRGFDPRRGRRRRHRGRGGDFGDKDNRSGDRRFTPPSRATEEPTGEPHPFEILPGESLAKYRNAGPSSEETKADYAESRVATSGGDDELKDKSPASFEDHQESAHSMDSGAGSVQASATSKLEQPRDEDTIAQHDEAVPFSPGAIYSRDAAVPSEDTPSVATSIPVEPVPVEHIKLTAEPDHEVEVPVPSISFEAETASDYGPEGVTAPTPVAADENDNTQSPSDRAELDEVDDDVEGEDEGIGEETELGEAEESEVAAEASESQLGDQGELPPGANPVSESGNGEATTSDRSYTLREQNQRPRFAPRRRRGRRGGFGDRGQRRGDRPQQPRSGGNHHPVQIAEVLKEGQEILVQIAKEPLGTKGARITSHVALPGRYLVYMPTISHIGVSRKIASEEERLRLRNIIQENKGALTGGFIVRTASQGRSEEEFKADLKFLSTLWSEIRSKHDRMKAPALIHRDLDLVQRLLRDLLTPDFKSVRVDSEIDYERVLDFVNRCQPALVGKVKLYSRDTPLYEEFGIQSELDKGLKPKVWLKSGGYIVINQTEALVAIDVNTGKFVGKTNRLEDTIVKTNIDAVNEIVRQVRLRDLGGIIVVDFIDMDERKNRAKVVQALEDALRADRAPTKVVAFNDFGLVAITRKRVKQSLERTLCVPCNYCTGSGWVKSVHTVCNEIMAEMKKMAKTIEGNVVTLRVNPDVAKYLKSREGNLVTELETIARKDIIIKGDPSVHQERFEIY